MLYVFRCFDFAIFNCSDLFKSRTVESNVRHVEGRKGFLSLRIKVQLFKLFELKTNTNFQLFKFLQLKITKLSFHVFLKILIPYYQIFVACFLEDIAPIFKSFKILQDGSSGIFGPCLFKTLKCEL